MHNLSTSSYCHGLSNPTANPPSGHYASPSCSRNYCTDTSSDEGCGPSTGEFIRPHPFQQTNPYYYDATAMLPPPNSTYTHCYPPDIGPPPRNNTMYPGPMSNPGMNPWYPNHPMGAAQHEQMLNLHFSNSNGREARNRAEKNRRDKLNGSIQELSSMVPHVADSPRRVDKTAVLRFSAHGLRLLYVFGNAINGKQSVESFVPDSLMRLLDSFLLTLTCRGQIVLVSPSVEQHLGHCQTDLFGQNIAQITHPDDQAMLKKQLIPTGLENLFDVQPEDESGEPRPRTKEEEEEIDRKLSADKRVFTVRLARAGPRSEPPTYEIVKIDGYFRRADSAPRGVKTSTYPSGLQLIRRPRGRDDSIPLHTISGNDIVLIALARVIKPPKVCERLLEANHYEYKTRHLIDGRIIQCDQRISLVAGYMTDEVNGLSPFTFMHQDDVRWVIVALRQMYDCNSTYGESCYRLITRTGKFIYLKTRGYLEIDKEKNKVQSFICINTLVDEDEGKRRVREMKAKFSVFVKTKIPPSAIDAPAAENPQQLERAILCLIHNLDKSNESEDDSNGPEKSDGSQRHSKSPPLVLVPPKPCTIKSSITKSVNVVNITAKHFQNKSHLNNVKSPNPDEEGTANSPTNREAKTPDVERKDENDRVAGLEAIVVKEENDSDCEQRVPPLPTATGYFEMSTYTQSMSSSSSLDPNILSCADQPVRSRSVLKRMRSFDQFEDENESIAPKRNVSENHIFRTPSIQDLTNPSADLLQVLPNSFEALDRSLLHVESATTELKDQCNNFRIDASTQHQLDEIIEEHQEQREMLESMQSEFQAHLNNTGPIRPNLKDNNPAFSNKNELKPR